MKIGILKCDSVLEKFRNEFQDYPEMFIRLLSAVEPNLTFATYDVRNGEYPKQINECDGYVITGSRASVYDNEPWIARFEEYIRELHTLCKPLVGICFGHQLIAQALDGKTEKAAQGWGVGVHTSRVVKKKPWQSPSKQTISVLVSHQDQVSKLPSDAELIVSSDFCPIAGFQIGKHILTFQSHPEFVPGYSAATMNNRAEKIGPERLEKGLASLAMPLDSALVGRWIVNFLNQAQLT